MRPDEHKKKKNDQYKKKHGMVGDKAGKGATDRTKGGAKSKSETKTRAQPASASASGSVPQSQGLDQARAEGHWIQNAASKDGCFSSGSANVNEQEGAVSSGRRTFRRREVASNWSRYEGLDYPTEEEIGGSLRGADFAQILGAASSSSSQFRFQDEKDWQSETGVSPSEVSDLLAINCAELSAALNCVPLHQRLHIEETAFQPHHIELFMADAAKHRDSQNLSAGDTDSESHKSIPESDLCDNMNTVHIKPDKAATPEIQLGRENQDPEDVLDLILGASEISISDSSVLNQEQSNALANSVSQQKLEEVANHTGDTSEETGSCSGTDQKLTNQPSTQSSNKSEEQCTPKPAVGSVPCNIEDELDFLLSVDDADKSVPISVEDKHDKSKISETAGATKTEDLESWLDDMLED